MPQYTFTDLPGLYFDMLAWHRHHATRDYLAYVDREMCLSPGWLNWSNIMKFIIQGSPNAQAVQV